MISKAVEWPECLWVLSDHADKRRVEKETPLMNRLWKEQNKLWKEQNKLWKQQNNQWTEQNKLWTEQKLISYRKEAACTNLLPRSRFVGNGRRIPFQWSFVRFMSITRRSDHSQLFLKLLRSWFCFETAQSLSWNSRTPQLHPIRQKIPKFLKNDHWSAVNFAKIHGRMGEFEEWEFAHV